MRLLKLLYPDQAILDKDIQGYIHSREAEVLSPATRPWQAFAFPIIGHYWGGATFEEVFEAVPREQIIDYLVFQWAINYTRIEIDKPNCGSQSREVALHLHVMEQLKPVLAEHNLTGTDYMGHSIQTTLIPCKHIQHHRGLLLSPSSCKAKTVGQKAPGGELFYVGAQTRSCYLKRGRTTLV